MVSQVWRQLDSLSGQCYSDSKEASNQCQPHLGALSACEPLVHQPDCLVVNKLYGVPVGGQNIPVNSLLLKILSKRDYPLVVQNFLSIVIMFDNVSMVSRKCLCLLA